MRADPADLAELIRLKFQNIQRVCAKALYHERRRRRADPPHGMTGKILVDRVCRLRHSALDILRLKLHSVCRVMGPDTGNGNHFTGSGKRDASENRDLVSVIRVKPEYGIPIFFVLINDGGDASAQLQHIFQFIHEW